MTKGITKKESYSCNRCKAQYSTEEQAQKCFSRGLPKILKSGTIYQRGNNFFAIEFLSGKSNIGTHERHYILGVFPEAIGLGYELIEGTASFDGQELHSIQGAHPRGGYVACGSGNAIRISQSQLSELLKNDEFRAFHKKTLAFMRR